MFLVLKSFAGVDYTLKSGKIISLRGGCALNEVSKADFDELLATYPSLQEAIDKEFVVVSGSKDVAKKQSDKAVDDTKQATADTQEKAQAKAEKAINAKVSKAEK